MSLFEEFSDIMHIFRNFSLTKFDKYADLITQVRPLEGRCLLFMVFFMLDFCSSIVCLLFPKQDFTMLPKVTFAYSAYLGAKFANLLWGTFFGKPYFSS